MNKNKKVFITGSTGGIGTSICDKFLNNNFTLLLTSSSSDKLERLKKKYGENHFYYKVDLSNEDNLQKCLDNVSKEHKGISVIVNNAGMVPEVIIEKVLASDNFDYGYNARTNTFGDLKEMGVIDPTLVLVSALRHSVSAADNLLSVACAMHE